MRLLFHAVFFLLLAAPAAAAPAVRVAAGFDGIHRVGAPLHLRVQLENDGPAWSGRFRAEETLNGRLSAGWEWPVEVPAGGQRTLFLSFTPASLGNPFATTDLRAGLAGEGELAPVGYRFLRGGPAGFVVLTITDRGTGYSAVRDALDPAGQAQGQIEVRLPAVPPEQLPPDVAAWEAVDAIVLDLAAGDRIAGPVWEAMRTRVAQGASLLVHGPGRLPGLFPDDLVPGRPPEGAVVGRWEEPGAGVAHSALSMQLRRGSKHPSVNGELLRWAATRRFGAGRVTVAGVELRNLRSPLSRQSPLWAELLGLPAAGRHDAVRPPAPAPPRVQAHAAARRSIGGNSLALLLGIAAACAGGAFIASRRWAKDERLLRIAPLLGIGAALPLLGAGLVSRVLEDRQPFVIEEHLAVLGATRTTTILEPSSSGSRLGSIGLEGWPPRLLLEGQRGAGPLGLEFRSGAKPSLEGLQPALLPGVAVQSESWGPAPAPFALERAPAGGLQVRNSSGRDLTEVHALDGATLSSLGPLADGAAVELGAFRPAFRDSPAARALEPAQGRLAGWAFAGVLPARGRGILGRPTGGVVAAWLEPEPP